MSLESKLNDLLDEQEASIDSVIKVQELSWDSNAYMHGMLNGMRLIANIIFEEKYEMYEVPKVGYKR